MVNHDGDLALAIRSLKEIRLWSHRSWVNIYEAARALQGLEHDELKPKVAAASAYVVRKIQRDTGFTLPQIEAFASMFMRKGRSRA